VLGEYLWKIRDLSESRIYKKDRKTKEFPRIDWTVLRDKVGIKKDGNG
jgi:hypothetical protein